jgi:hypothetical protein
MLVRIALPVADLAALGPDALELRLSELLRAHRNGFHLVVIERDAADYLLEHVAFSGSDRALLQRLRQQFTQNGRLHERATIYLEVHTLGDAIIRTDRCFKIPINMIDSVTFGSPSQFLTEDANHDAKVIRFILSNVRDILGAPTFSFVDEHGGGASTLQRYTSALVARKIGICVMDTDRRSPLAEICSITKRAMAARDRSGWPLFDVAALPCRELENIIPHGVVMMLDSAEGCEWNRIIPRIEDWETVGRKSEKEAFWLFFDVKQGLSHIDLEAFSPSEIAWVEPRIGASGRLSGEWAYPGYGERVVAQMMQNNQALDALRKAIRRSDWKDVFKSYFNNIIWFGAASVKLNT